MKLDAFASESHYSRHLWPVWKALPEEVLGTFYLGGLIPGAGPRHRRPPRVKGGKRPPLLVAAARDLQAGRPAILVEHGSGQRYIDRPDHPAYSGGNGRGAVVLFLCPNHEVAERNLVAYPGSRAEVVGAPILDRWFRTPRLTRLRDPLVAFSFHWRCKVAPEADSAWDHYGEKALALLLAYGVRLLGHAHPRMQGEISKVCERLGIDFEPDLDRVLERADLYLVDNSSSGFEAMAAGIPVVWLNAPWYRREIWHGLRFWEFAPAAIQCDQPEELLGAIEHALSDPPQVRKLRRDAVIRVYSYADDKASERAARAIVEVLNELRDD